MTIPKSAENIRKIELSLDELIPKIEGRLQLIREDLKSLVNSIEAIKNIIEEKRRKSNDNTREISDLSNGLQTIRNEIQEIELEISKTQNKVDITNKQMLEIQSDLTLSKHKLETLKIEKETLNETIRGLEIELTSLLKIQEEIKPKFEASMNILMNEYKKLKGKSESIDNRFQAMRTLCSEDYIQSPEIGLIKFLAKKASSTSTITEIHSALGMDSKTLISILNKLAARNILTFNEKEGNINLLVNIDLFN